jgi:hypothetical protein
LAASGSNRTTAPAPTPGTWTQEAGFYSKYFASATSDSSASVTISYICGYTHDLWIGTSLYSDRANASVSVDNDAATPLIAQLTTDEAVVTRRQARTGIAAGRHTVTIRPTTSGVFYFNFLEAAVASAVPDALAPRGNISPSLDFDTNHSYTLPPARIMWMMEARLRGPDERIPRRVLVERARADGRGLLHG